MSSVSSNSTCAHRSNMDPQPAAKKMRLQSVAKVSQRALATTSTALPASQCQQQQRKASGTTHNCNFFPIHPIAKFRAPFPTYKEPEEIVSFSYDESHKVQMDDRELKYYREPTINADKLPDLLEGFDKRITRNPCHVDHVDGLLQALEHIRKDKDQTEAIADTKKHQADFVMYRGMMTRILCTPFLRRDAWEMNATLYKGTIYVEDNVTPQRVEERTNVPERMREMMYMGYRFEQLLTSTTAATAAGVSIADDPGEVVDTNREYCSIFKTQLGRHRIIMGAEVDCIEGKKPKAFANRQYVELKTNKLIQTDKDRWSFRRYKLLKFWAQSFLAGIRKVVVGYRTDEGKLNHVETIRTSDMPRQVRGIKGMWEANVCMNFADGFLTWLSDAVTVDDPNAVYRIKFEENSQGVQIEYLGSDPGHSFLLDSFVKSVGTAKRESLAPSSSKPS